MKKERWGRWIGFTSIPVFIWLLSVWVFSDNYISQAVVHLGRISNWASFMLRNDPVYQNAATSKDLAYIPISTRKAFNSYVIKFPISFYGFFNGEKFLRIRSPLSEMKGLPQNVNFHDPIFVDGDSITWEKTKTQKGTTILLVKSVLSQKEGKRIELILSQELGDYDHYVLLFSLSSGVFFLLVSLVVVFSYRYTTGALVSQIGQLNRAVSSDAVAKVQLFTELKTSRFNQVRGLSSELLSAFETQSRLSEKIESAGNELIDQSKHLGVFIDLQSRSFNELTHNISDVSVSSTQIARSSEHITDLAKTLTTQSKQNKAKIAEASRSVNDLVERMDKIEANTLLFREMLNKNIEEIEAITRITDVVSQINDNLKLISFNAQLEAVGDKKQTQRFMVVATEVRDLAVNVETTLKKIKSQLIDIVEKSRESGHMFKSVNQLVLDGTKRLHEISDVIHLLEEQYGVTMKSVNTITKSATEQLSALSQIAHSMNQMRMESGDLSKNLDRLTAKTAELKENGQNLADLITEL
ncbi:MAG: methyl-accepting chemotaxis protein [Bacteroidetes bacterium]|nr:methyl-accepting chemotaxis protein [Bacteroidota bacterium]